ncbi:zinc finger protein 525 [Ixodes scapularis]
MERSHGAEAALMWKTSCPLKAPKVIWFGCSSCTYFTRDQRGIVSHLVAHGDEQIKHPRPLMSPGSRSKVDTNTQMHKGFENTLVDWNWPVD